MNSSADTHAVTYQAEINAITQVVATVEHAQNNESPEELLSVFRSDAIWTTGGGKRLYGLAQISAFTHQVLPGGMKGLSLTFELEHVLFIRPDVAAVKLRQIYQTPEGPDLGTPLWIMAKENGRWLLTACQNIGVPEEELDEFRTAGGTRTVFTSAD